MPIHLFVIMIDTAYCLTKQLSFIKVYQHVRAAEKTKCCIKLWGFYLSISEARSIAKTDETELSCSAVLCTLHCVLTVICLLWDQKLSIFLFIPSFPPQLGTYAVPDPVNSRSPVRAPRLLFNIPGNINNNKKDWSQSFEGGDSYTKE